MTVKQQTTVKYATIAVDYAEQRIDNYLLAQLKGVPKSHIYRLLRRGEVRVNMQRVRPAYRLQAGDKLRIPPVRQSEQKRIKAPEKAMQALVKCILYEDDDLVILNKPAGMAVHGGTGLVLGVIEILRQHKPQYAKLELAHRLDKDTSGCLLLAKKRRVLKELHSLFRDGVVEKKYVALVKGHWPVEKQAIHAPLKKNQTLSGERVVRVHQDGKPATTAFKPLQYFTSATLLGITLKTGRTHQIRVHTVHAGHPIAGDEKYGDKYFNRLMRVHQLKRLFLHANSLCFTKPNTQQTIQVSAALEPALKQVLMGLKE